MHVEEVSDVQDRMKSAEAIAKEFEWIAKAKLAYRSESLFADRFGDILRSYSEVRFGIGIVEVDGTGTKDRQNRINGHRIDRARVDRNFTSACLGSMSAL